MKISINTDYILRAMYELAINKDNGPVSIAVISRRQHIPKKYLEKLFQRLKKSGIVRSVWGKYGGYQLTREPVDISMKDIIQAAEGQISIHNCRERLGEKSCDIYQQCVFKDFWNKFNAHINSYLESYSLASFLQVDGENRKES